MTTRENKAKSKAQGRPIFDEREMVEIRIPGDKLAVWVGRVEDEHRNRWPELYAAFKRGEERAASGTPLEEWTHPLMTRSRVAELKALNVLSVEELAAVSDNVIPSLGMGGRELRTAAAHYLANAKGDATAELTDKIARLEAMVEQLTAAGRPAAAAPAPAPEPAEVESWEGFLDDASDETLKAFIRERTGEELKAFIREKTGEAPRGRISRETLEARAAELAVAA
jgi:hypothetical protein